MLMILRMVIISKAEIAQDRKKNKRNNNDNDNDKMIMVSHNNYGNVG